MSEKQVFFSYYHETDHWRAAKIRQMHLSDKRFNLLDASWAEVEDKSDPEIEEWIDKQLEASTAVVVLIGEETAKKKRINYTMKKAYEWDKGIAGVYIHKLLDETGHPSERGENPFDYMDLNGIKFSRFVKVHDSEHIISRYVYHDIRNNFADLIDYALENKPSTWKWELYSAYE